MTQTEIIQQLQEIFRDVLDNESIVLSDTTCAADIEEWGSLANVQLIVEIESELGVRFTSGELISWKNVGEMARCIASKI